jgi:hypothetical protein
VCLSFCGYGHAQTLNQGRSPATTHSILKGHAATSSSREPVINVHEVRFTPLKGDGDVGFVPNRRLMHGSKELKLFDHFVGAGEGKYGIVVSR